MVECPTCAFRNQDSDAFCGSCGLFLWVEAPVGVPGAAARGSAAGGGRPGAPGASTATTIPAGRRGEGATDPACRTCKWQNARTRRFCGRCGASLVRAVAVEEAPPAVIVVPPWWQRMMWWRLRRALRVFEAGARPGRRAVRRTVAVPDVKGRAAPLRRAMRWLRATLRRIWPDVFLVLLVIALIILVVPGARRAVVGANPFRHEPPGFMAPVSCTEPVEQGASLSEFPPAFACDNKPATFWATDIDKRSGRSPRLWVDFARPVDLREFHITVGEVSAGDVLSSESLQNSGRPAHVCLRFYTSEKSRLTDYLYDDARDDKAQPLATVQIPRPDAGPEAPDCPGFTDTVIGDDTEEHRFSFAEVKDVLGVGIEMRDVHAVGPGQAASNVFVSGVEFFGHPAAKRAPSSAPPRPKGAGG
jgi:hypothetical protein